MPSSRLPRILLVDDEPTVLAMMARALTESGYDVLPATNGVEALELAAGAQPHVDAVVTDVRMPQMDGEALAAALRQANPDLPILFVSGFNGGPAPTPPGTLLAKPFTPDQLVAAVGQLVTLPTSRHATA
jgi:two-component system, cell cycle sensor histidine kinase and response regulator CckA